VLGKALELKIVVEGVESKEQFELLREQYEVDFVQGFYFSKALSKENASDYIFRSNDSSNTTYDNQQIQRQNVA